MEDGTTATRKPVARPFDHSPSLSFRRGLQPHHRRRRAVALALTAAVALAVGVVLGAGGGSVTHRPQHGTAGYFARIHTLGGVGAGSFAAEEQGSETAAINRTLGYTPYVRIAGSQHKEIALTFDDGPGPYTPQIVSILQRTGVPGTFFEVGVVEKDFHTATSEIVSAGYPIGDHTENHAAMGQLSPKDQKTQLLQDVGTIGQYGAPFPRLFRPPYGSWNNATLRLLHKYRMLMVLWTVDTDDYLRPGVKTIVHSAVAGARPGAIILLHDAGGPRSQTVLALPKIIADLRRRGYRFVTVPKLLLDNPAGANQHFSALAGGGG
jgi:peptidoglycan/xylan/chitin deacetylase (PgdA/CDA1 family)